MPPRRSARVAAVAERATSALSPLPLPVVLYIFSLLPVDCRLRCTEVCRGWRAMLLERSLWTALDLSATSGVLMREGHALDALLRCAAARAGGGLQSLRVDCSVVSRATLLEIVAASAGVLRELHAHVAHGTVGFYTHAIQAWLDAAPLLDVLATDLRCDDTDLPAARLALRNEAPFGPLHVRHLAATLGNEDAAGVIAFAADVAAHASLSGLSLSFALLGTAAAMDAVVDAALARRLHSVSFQFCNVSPASAPALARLLGGDAVTALECSYMDRLLDAPAAAVLAAALRENSTLTSLTLNNAGVFDDAAAGVALVGSLTGHASLQTISVRDNDVADADKTAVGESLGALVAANAPALTQLELAFCDLRDDGMRALFEALPRNTHLRTLNCSQNGMSEPFLRDVLLPAVRANTSLRELVTDPGGASAAEAERIMRSRAAV
jgi:hypothetical protein